MFILILFRHKIVFHSLSLKLLCAAKHHEKDCNTSTVTSHFLGPANFFESMKNLSKRGQQFLACFDSMYSAFVAGFIATHTKVFPGYRTKW